MAISSPAIDELLRRAGPRHISGPGDAVVLEELGKTYRDGTEAVRGISLRIA